MLYKRMLFSSSVEVANEVGIHEGLMAMLAVLSVIIVGVRHLCRLPGTAALRWQSRSNQRMAGGGREDERQWPG